MLHGCGRPNCKMLHIKAVNHRYEVKVCCKHNLSHGFSQTQDAQWRDMMDETIGRTAVTAKRYSYSKTSILSSQLRDKGYAMTALIRHWETWFEKVLLIGIIEKAQPRQKVVRDKLHYCQITGSSRAFAYLIWSGTSPMGQLQWISHQLLHS